MTMTMTMTNFEIHATDQTQKLITKLIRPEARLDPITTVLDHLAKHFTNKPETLNKLTHEFVIPSPAKLIHALVRLAMYSPNERPSIITKWLSVNMPWLDRVSLGHIRTTSLAVLIYLEEWLEYTRAYKVLGREQISTRVYRLLNCLIAGLGTNALFYGMIPRTTNLADCVAYLFVVAGCYTLLDSLIDQPSSHGETTKCAIKIFDWYITQLETDPVSHTIIMYPIDQLSPEMQEYTRAVHWLVCLLIKSVSASDSSRLQEVIGIIRLCFNVEIRCFREQTQTSQSSESIIQLGVFKGLSTGYLISQGVLTPLYSEYSVLVQLLDDLSDYMEDSHAGIRGFPACACGIRDYAIFVGECLAEFIDSYSKCLAKDSGLILGGPDAAEYVIPALIMYWIYCMCKTPQLADLTRECIERLGLSGIMDPRRILDSRQEKHAALQNLWKIVKQFRC